MDFLFPAHLALGDSYVTPREAEVLWYCTARLTAKTMAENMGVSYSTVKRHKENIRLRFDLHGTHALNQFTQKWRPELSKWVG